MKLLIEEVGKFFIIIDVPSLDIQTQAKNISDCFEHNTNDKNIQKHTAILGKMRLPSTSSSWIDDVWFINDHKASVYSVLSAS